MSTTAPSFEPLRGRIAGRVVSREDDGWDAARLGFNLTVDQQPTVVVLPTSADDVVEVVRFARASGLRVAPQGTGHNAGPIASLQDTILLRTTAMTGVQLDVEARRARVAAGAVWRDVVGPASEHGLAALHGSAPNLTVVGYTLGGGMGWYARAHGLAADHVASIELVTADGEQLTVDAEREPELFWALRGGGGNFGVVTALTLELLPIRELYAGALFFPWERTSEVLHAWAQWTAGAPEEVTSCGRIMQFPPFPEVPEPVRGKAFVLVEAACLLDAGAAEELLQPLRALGPAMDTFATVAPAGIADLHMDPPAPVPARATHRLLTELPGAAVDALVGAAGPDSGSSLLSVEVRQTGGALARRAPGAGALASLPGGFAFFAVGIAAGPAAAAVAGDLERVGAALAPFDAGRYLNFVEQPFRTADAFDAETYRRLQEVKAKVDPDDLICANHPIAPAG